MRFGVASSNKTIQIDLNRWFANDFIIWERLWFLFKKIEYVAKEYPPSSEIIESIEKRYKMIGEQLEVLKKLLD